MTSTDAKTRMGCGPILLVIVIGMAGWIGYRIYADHQRVVGLPELVSRASTAARAEQMSPALKEAVSGTTNPLELGEAVNGLLTGPLTHDISVFPTPSNTFKAPIAVVDLDKRSIDETQGRLPAKVRARDIASAQTVVFVRCFQKKIGEYGWLQGAYRRTCDLVGFDMKAQGGPLMLASASFDREPPKNVSTAEFWYAFHDVVAARPVSNMAWFVKVQLGLIDANTPP